MRASIGKGLKKQVIIIQTKHFFPGLVKKAQPLRLNPLSSIWFQAGLMRNPKVYIKTAFLNYMEEEKTR